VLPFLVIRHLGGKGVFGNLKFSYSTSDKKFQCRNMNEHINIDERLLFISFCLILLLREGELGM
jgi:hypothetical protein